jgi:nucleoside-diphosphate-sugar epimerase
MNHVIKIIEKIAGRPLKIQRAEAQKGDMRDTYADTTLAKKDLGFSPKVTLEEGIQAEYRWLASSPALV